MSNSKKIIGSIVAGATLGVGIYGYMHLSKPEITEANSKSQYVNSVAELKEEPIIGVKMFKANDNYGSLSGTIVKTGEVENSITEVVIAQPDRYYVKFIPNSNDKDVYFEAVNDGKSVQIKEDKGQIVESNPFPTQSIKESQNLKENKKGDNEVRLNLNGTFLPIGNVNEMLHPEMYVQSVFRRGDMNVLGEEKYLERDVTVIEISNAQLKIGDRQKFWIDNKTGIVLKTVLYDDDDEVQSQYFESIEFNNKKNTGTFKLFK
ncbi:hypothetical protein AV540_10250 [Brevibacillus parabrevis]|uniref:hypothetical protein n=1 Tax=Brevibacillus parabrevis TaxID=54914 RepID=UPI0007ABF7B8|nr:hypothetical protein [Brevibacillus parabrevis]KZE52245.1 hypothetical protein AV540_10250 [Brevibacillus parabrevis]